MSEDERTIQYTYDAFTGEPRDANGLQYHRARYYAPGLDSAYHATVTVNDTNGSNIPNLSDELAETLSVVFWRKMPNPNIVSR